MMHGSGAPMAPEPKKEPSGEPWKEASRILSFLLKRYAMRREGSGRLIVVSPHCTREPRPARLSRLMCRHTVAVSSVSSLHPRDLRLRDRQVLEAETFC